MFTFFGGGCRDVRQVSGEDEKPMARAIEIALSPIASAGEADRWEDTISQATVFVYRQQDYSSNAVPVLKYLFTAKDILQGRALLPMEPDFLAGQMVDIYTVANSRDTNIFKGNKPLTRGDLFALIDSNAISRYNNSSYVDISRSIASSGGFTMAGYTSVMIEQSATAAQQIPISIKRTVSKIDVEVVTNEVEFRKYVTNLNEAAATLHISAAWLLRGNRRVPVFEQEGIFTDDYLSPYTRNDSLVQGNDKYLPTPYRGEFLFYVFPTADRGVIHDDDDANSGLKLWLRTVYDPDNNTATSNSRTIFFSIPIQAGSDVNRSQAIVRNTRYKVMITVVGIGGGVVIPDFAPVRSSDGEVTLNYVVGGASR